MNRAGRLVAALAVTTIVVVGWPTGAASSESELPEGGRVVVVSIPTLTWQLVEEERPAALTSLFGRAAVASVSVRTATTMTTLGSAYATVGAGTRSAAAPDSGWAFPPGEEFLGTPAGDVFRRRTGRPAETASAVHLGIAPLRALNDRLLYGAEPGLLAQELVAAGRTVAVVGNADIVGETDPRSLGLHREIALAGMLPDGRVLAGAVGTELLVDDIAAPFGVWLDGEQLLEAVDESAGADVLFVELSDLWRADQFRKVALGERSARLRTEALARTDELLARLLDRIDTDRDLVLVLAPVSRWHTSELGVAMATGPRIEPGLLRSGTTRRPGYVTLPDVAPTILDRFGLDLPTEFSGAPISSAGGGSPDESVMRDLVEDNRMALFRNVVTGPLTVVLVVLQILGYAITAVVFARRAARWYGAVSFLALTTLAVPVVAFLSGVFAYRILGVVGYIAAVFAAAALLAAASVAVGHLAFRSDSRRARLLPPTLVAAVTVGVLLVDIALGGPLQIDTPFGYGGGAIVAGRFAGYGNLAWGTLAAALFVVVCGAWSLAVPPGHSGVPGRRRRPLLVLFAGLGGACILAIGLPQLGLNVGGTLSTIPGVAIALLLLAGVPLTLRRVALVAAGSVVILLAFGFVDLLRPPESRTHLGRLMALTSEQGVAGLGTVLERKMTANFRILTSSVWALLIPAAIGFLIFLTVRSPRIMQRLRDGVPGFQPAVVGALVTGVLAGLLNDSGVAIPAMMLVIMLPFVAWLAVMILDVRVPATTSPPAPADGSHRVVGKDDRL